MSRFTTVLLVSLVLLVVAPLLFAVLSSLHMAPEFLDTFLFIFYFRLPSLVFGATFFSTEMGAAPKSFWGWVVTGAFYGGIAFFIACISYVSKDPSKHD